MVNDKSACCAPLGWRPFVYPRFIMASPPVLPRLYWDPISDEQRIKWICERVEMIEDGYGKCLTIDDFNEFLALLEKDQQEQTQEAHDYADAQDQKVIAYLMEVIDKLQIGMLVWDVTQGKYTDSVEANRNMFDWVTVDGITVDTLANLPLTVDQLAESGLNVRGLAVYGRYLVGDSFVPEGIFYSKGA